MGELNELRTALKRHGRSRTAARERARQESEAIASLAPRALDAGMTKVEVCELAQITRPALDAMLRQQN